MATLREWLARLWSAVRPHRPDADIEEELRLHLELAAEADRRRADSGLAPHRSAAIRVGSVAQTMETVRDQRGLPWLDDLSRDVRHGLRSLRRNPLFASIAIVTLGLAIGINTAIFSVIETVMLRTLRVQNPNELYFVGYGSLERPGLGSNYPYYERIRALTDVFAGVTAYTTNAFKVSIGDVTEITQGQYVSGNYHSVLGIPIVRGRGFSSVDRLGADALSAVISDGYWTRKFARSPDVIGRTIVIDGRPVSIVGVTAPRFEGLESGTPLDITLPLAVKALDAKGFLTMHDTWTSMPILARLRPGVTRSQAALAVEPVFQQYFSEPENAWLKHGPRSVASRGSQLLSAARGSGGVRAQYSKPLGVLTAMVVVVLLIACANLANLLLARGAARAKEVAVRLSIGAGRARLVRQYLTESLLLSLLGGALGLALAWAGARTIVALVDIGPNPVHLDVQLNTTVLAFTAAISILAGLLFGLAPALRTTRVELTPSLKEVGAAVGPRRLWSLRQLLVSAQIALCLTLVSSATLLTRTLQNLEIQDGGFDRRNLLMFSLDARGTAFPVAQMPRFCADLIDRLVARFDVPTGSCSTSVPIDSRGNARPLDVPGAPAMDVDARLVFMNRVTPDYFRTLGIGVVGGRVFDARDTASSEKVAVINRATARNFFGNTNPIGRTVHFYKDDDNPITIVGLVQDARQYSLRQDPLNTFYTPLSQVAEPESLVTVTLRSRGDTSPIAAALRSEVRALNTDVVVNYIRTMEQQIDVTLVRERLLAMLSTAFGLLALTLACVGLYGVVSYDVARRTRELGIRLALGARRADLLGRVLRGALSISSIGVLAGLLLALAATGLLSSLLFGIAPRDPLALASAAALIVATTLTASYFPARRASRLDPARVLRSE